MCVVFPRVADRAEHQQRVEHEVGGGTDRDDGGRSRCEPVLFDGFVGGPNRVPGSGRGQFGVHQQHRRLVLQCLERADGSAELLAGADVIGRRVGAPTYRARGRARREGHHDATRPLGGNAGQRRAFRNGVVGEMERTDVGAQVGALLLFDGEVRAL